jgi:hypothetical protein
MKALRESEKHARQAERGSTNRIPIRSFSSSSARAASTRAPLDDLFSVSRLKAVAVLSRPLAAAGCHLIDLLGSL